MHYPTLVDFDATEGVVPYDGPATIPTAGTSDGTIISVDVAGGYGQIKLSCG